MLRALSVLVIAFSVAAVESDALTLVSDSLVVSTPTALDELIAIDSDVTVAAGGSLEGALFPGFHTVASFEGSSDFEYASSETSLMAISLRGDSTGRGTAGLITSNQSDAVLNLFDDSSFEFAGVSVAPETSVSDRATLTFNDGGTGGIFSSGDSRVFIHGGSVGDGLFEGAILEITGGEFAPGRLGAFLLSFGATTQEVSGGSFADFNGTRMLWNVTNGLTVIGTGLSFSGNVLTGVLADGTALDVEVSSPQLVTLLAAPEASSAVLVALAGLLLSARRRTPRSAAR